MCNPSHVVSSGAGEGALDPPSPSSSVRRRGSLLSLLHIGRRPSSEVSIGTPSPENDNINHDGLSEAEEENYASSADECSVEQDGLLCEGEGEDEKISVACDQPEPDTATTVDCADTRSNGDICATSVMSASTPMASSNTTQPAPSTSQSTLASTAASPSANAAPSTNIVGAQCSNASRATKSIAARLGGAGNAAAVREESVLEADENRRRAAAKLFKKNDDSANKSRIFQALNPQKLWYESPREREREREEEGNEGDHHDTTVTVRSVRDWAH